MSDFFEKYKDPRWQKMRLEIMQRDEYTCQRCKSTTKTLNVHHAYYVKGSSPWEYEPGALVTLCEDCHKVVQDKTQACRELLGYCWEWNDRIYGYLMAIHASMVGRTIFLSSKRENYWSMTQGIADFWNVHPDDVGCSGSKLDEETWVFHTEDISILPKLTKPGQQPEYLAAGYFSEGWEQRDCPGDI